MNGKSICAPQFATMVGTSCHAMSSPSCPDALFPQHQSVPSVARPQVKLSPAVTCEGCIVGTANVPLLCSTRSVERFLRRFASTEDTIGNVLQELRVRRRVHSEKEAPDGSV